MFQYFYKFVIVYDRSLSTSDNFIRIATNMPKNVVSVRVLSERIQTDQSLAALARFTKLLQKFFLAVNLDLKISQK